MTCLRDEQLIEAFVQRGQRDWAIITEEQLDDGWGRLRRSEVVAPRPHRRTLRLRLGLATALAAAAVAIVAYRFAPDRSSSPLQYSLEGAVASTTNKITSAADAGSRLRFNDDSRIDLAALTTVSVDAVAESGAQVALIEGAIDVFVKPRAHSAWTFTAGPFRVKVKGTSFRLSYASARHRLDLHMTSGLVEVTDSQGRVMTVSAGESIALFGDPTIAPEPHGEDAPATPLPRENSTLPQEAQAPVHGVRANPSEAPHRRPAVHVKDGRDEPIAAPPVMTWSRLITQGRYSEVIAEAQKRGLDVTLAQASAADLSALADAARYTKRHDLAREALFAVRARFAGTEPARDASFFLGRLGEAVPGQPEAALGWYETYLREAPRGLYASEALGREMTLLTAKDRGRASKLAKQYLERFPRGSQAELARSLVETGSD